MMRRIEWNVMWTLAVVQLFVSSAPAWAEDAVNAQFELSPAGSITAHTAQIVQNLAKQKDGSFQATKIEVPLATLKTDNSLRDNHMKNKYLEVQKYPTATLTGLKAKDGKFEGALNLHGKTGKIKGDYKVEGNKIRAHFPILLSQYGIVVPTYMGVGVEDEGKIEIVIPYQQVAKK